jgi:hypothetical protein
MNAKATVIVFCALLFGIAGLNLAQPDRAVSESENRYLQQMPGFSWVSLADGRFTAGFESYVTDQFLLRDRWVGAKTMAERAAGRMSSKGVYFAAGNSLIEMFGSVDREAYRRNLGYVAGFAERVETGLGVPVSTMLVPTAPAILRDKLPPFAPEPDQEALLAEAAGLLPGFVNVTEALRGHSAEAIYYRTDHHWTSLGAFYAYNCWRGARGLEARSPGDYSTETLTEDFYGTTWSKASLYTIPPDTMEAWVPAAAGEVTVSYNRDEATAASVYERGFLAVKDKYSVFLGENQPLVQINTGAEGGKRLLLVKDSYANSFAQLLLADYSEIHLIDPRFFRESAYEYIAANGITEVLVLYNLKGFAGDQSLINLTQPEGTK